MAKRMIDTNIFRDPWFMDLSKDGKLIWIYLFCNCDHAGMYELNGKLLKFETGITDIDKAFEQLGNRCLRVKQGLYFIPKFLYFQYPSFPNSKVKAQDSAIKILEQSNLFKEGKLTVTQPLDKGYDNDNDNGCDNDNGTDKPEEKDLDFTYEESYEGIITEWFEYKKQRGETYKSKASRQKFYNSLYELTKGDINKAQKIIDQSMANNWAGIFELKTKPKVNTSMF